MSLKIQTVRGLRITGDAAALTALANSLLAAVSAGHGFSGDEGLPDVILTDEHGKIRMPGRPGSAQPKAISAQDPDEDEDEEIEGDDDLVESPTQFIKPGKK